MSLPVLAVELAQFINPEQGPSQSGDFEISPTAFVVVMTIGFLIAVFGHIIRAKTLVATGIGMIFLATFLVPVAIHLSR